MEIGILIPYRGLCSDKSRLRKQLSIYTVEKLLFLMTQHVISTALAIKKSRTYLVTKLDKTAFKGDFILIKDKENDLNASITKALNNIDERIVLILMADLPLIKKESIEKVVELCKKEKGIIIAPSPDNGTSILCFERANTFPFFFGKSSSLKFVNYFEINNFKYKLLECERSFSDIDTFKDLIKMKQVDNPPKWLKHILNGINNEGKNRKDSKNT